MQEQKQRRGRDHRKHPPVFAGGPVALDREHVLDVDGDGMTMETETEEEREQVTAWRLRAKDYFADANTAWERGISTFREQAKGRADGASPDVLGEFGSRALSLLKRVIPTISEGAGLDEKGLSKWAGSKIGKVEARGLGEVESGAERFETTADRTKGALTKSLELGLADAVALASIVGSKLEQIHAANQAALRSESLDGLTHKLIVLGREVLGAWRRYIEVALGAAVRSVAQQTGGFRHPFYAADVYAMCERMLFEAMTLRQPVAETLNHRTNLPGFITGGTRAGIQNYGRDFASPAQHEALQ